MSISTIQQLRSDFPGFLLKSEKINPSRAAVLAHRARLCGFFVSVQITGVSLSVLDAAKAFPFLTYLMRVNFMLGSTHRVVPEPFAKGVITLVGGVVGDPRIHPLPGSIIMRCGKCQSRVWIEPNHVLRQELERMPVACLNCFKRYKLAGGDYELRDRTDTRPHPSSVKQDSKQKVFPGS